MTLAIAPITPDFAGTVTGIDCRRPLSPAEITAIAAGMDRFAVLVFPAQHLSDAEQLAFTLQFGVIETSGGGGVPIHLRTAEQRRSLGQGIGDFSNVDPAGKPLATDSRAHMFKLADRLWHSDSSFKAVPARHSLLSARAVPSWGGNTEFADMRAAYDALDARTRAAVENLVCHHSQMYSREKIGFTALTAAEREAYRPVRQRLVRRHPSSGRKSLFLSSHAGEIEGMQLPEARMLLLDLAEFATQPRFVYSHAWTLGDLVMWDNQATMHRGRPFDAAEPRDMRQTRLAGAAETIEQAA